VQQRDGLMTHCGKAMAKKGQSPKMGSRVNKFGTQEPQIFRVFAA